MPGCAAGEPAILRVHEHGRVIITKHGRPAAVMLSLEDGEAGPAASAGEGGGVGRRVHPRSAGQQPDPGRAAAPLRARGSAHCAPRRLPGRVPDRPPRRRVTVLAVGHRADIYRRG
ncbi:MAG: type II toxin-antitoxin system prevent-host-death family antitoxin [Actinomycetota bacterium]